jgi:hypothetical protein
MKRPNSSTGNKNRMRLSNLLAKTSFDNLMTLNKLMRSDRQNNILKLVNLFKG